jgi:hypothetical protein
VSGVRRSFRVKGKTKRTTKQFVVRFFSCREYALQERSEARLAFDERHEWRYAMPRFPMHLPDVRVPEVQPANIPVEAHPAADMQAPRPNAQSSANSAQPFIGRRDRTGTRFEPYARPLGHDVTSSGAIERVAPRQSASSLLWLARAQLSQSVDRGMQHELNLRSGQYWTDVHTRIWADHARSCAREVALSEAHLAQQRAAASEGDHSAACNVRVVDSGLAQLREEWNRAQGVLGRLTQHQGQLMNEIFRNQQDLYRQLIQRNGIDEQLQALERDGSAPRTGSERSSWR